jgi:hypothetical protein
MAGRGSGDGTGQPLKRGTPGVGAAVPVAGCVCEGSAALERLASEPLPDHSETQRGTAESAEEELSKSFSLRLSAVPLRVPALKEPSRPARGELAARPDQVADADAEPGLDALAGIRPRDHQAIALAVLV